MLLLFSDKSRFVKLLKCNKMAGQKTLILIQITTEDKNNSSTTYLPTYLPTEEFISIHITR